jgi:endoglucanase
VRYVVVVALTLALGGVAVGCGGGGKSSDGSSDSNSKKGTESAGQRFLDRYVTPDGRVQRIDQGGDTVGEGQAYGMLIAAAIGDEKRFDLIWAWTKDNLRRKDGLISFLWRDGKVQDPQAASDADVDAVRALLVAACRFNKPALRQEALELGRAIMKVETAEVQGGPVLVAGPWATKDPQTVNPSYFSPATFAAVGAASGDGAWGSLSKSSRSITDELMQDPNRLPPDWARLEGGKPKPSGPPDNPKGTPAFGFDAVRTLVRMAEDPDPAGREIAARAWPVFDGQDPNTLPVEHDLTGKPTGGTMSPVVLVAAAGAADAAGKTADRDKFLNAAESLDKRQPTYYGAAWVALGRIMLTTDQLKSCS